MKSLRCRQKKQHSDWLKRKFRKDIVNKGYIFFYIIKVIKRKRYDDDRIEAAPKRSGRIV